MLMWETVEFGRAHRGRPGVLLADGSEPEPVLFDGGSGANFHESSDWWFYSGESRRPLATDLRGACSCGWRGEPRYPLDWEQVDENAPYLYDTSGPRGDWDRHIAGIEALAATVPDELTVLLDQVEQQLGRLAGDAPLAALRAISRMEHIVTEVGRTAAYGAQADARGGTPIGPGLGLPEEEARRRLLRYSLRH
ncbi:hypothetical protein RM717_24720 [Streptomyces griseus]|uniref:Uncharacterized protein n=1 Tax=Streptomyces stephensoniae TaxID=3375367 RepID=A0ABU2W7W0_9ACTN|nr:hypothetical protein [Streptomyces griseus]